MQTSYNLCASQRHGAPQAHTRKKSWQPRRLRTSSLALVWWRSSLPAVPFPPQRLRTKPLPKEWRKFAQQRRPSSHPPIWRLRRTVRLQPLVERQLFNATPWEACSSALMARQFAGGVGVLAMAAIDTQIGIVAVPRRKLYVPKSNVLKTRGRCHPVASPLLSQHPPLVHSRRFLNAASIPSSTSATGNPAPFIRNTVSLTPLDGYMTACENALIRTALLQHQGHVSATAHAPCIPGGPCCTFRLARTIHRGHPLGTGYPSYCGW